MDSFREWARQPTTVAGISASIATVSALLLKQLTWVQAIPLLTGAFTSMVLPDNAVAQKQAEQIATEMVTKINTGKGVVR